MFTIDKFTFVEVTSEELRKAIYKLRYQVYAEEFGFEKKEDHPSGYETDEYENHSIHLAALNENEDVIGTLRLVLHSEKGFPIEHAVKDLAFIGNKPEPDRIGEISRLAVSRDYRRRQEDGFYGVESYIMKSEGGILPDKGQPIPDQYLKRRRPVIVLGLYRLLYHTSKRRGISHWYFITEKKLFYALKRYGFLFNQIGEPVEYHGVRIPYLGIIEEIEKFLAENKRETLQLMLRDLEEKYHPPF